MFGVEMVVNVAKVARVERAGRVVVEMCRWKGVENGD